MAEDSLNDDSSSFNRDDPSRFLDLQLSKYLASLSDEFIGRLMEARALIAVGIHGLSETPSEAQRCFLGVVDNILEGAILSFEEIIEDHVEDENKLLISR